MKARTVTILACCLCVLGLSVNVGCSDDGEPGGTPTGTVTTSTLTTNTGTTPVPATVWQGTPVTESIPYESGDGLRVVQDNGRIVVERGTGNDVAVTFSPFTMRGADEEAEAIAEMAEDLTLLAEDQGAFVVVQVAKATGSSSYLGANVTITLPAAFDGTIEVDSNNGGLDLSAVTGPLVVEVDNGETHVVVSEWAAADSSVRVGNGSLVVVVAAGLEGTIAALADGPGAVINDPSPLPADWTVTETSPSSKSYEFGDDPSSGGTMALTTGNGDITIDVE